MYLLDANVLMDASRRYYSAKLAPAFWQWLEAQHQAGTLASIHAVRQEIDDGNEGHLTKWAKKLPPSFWIKPTQPSVVAMGTLTNWTMLPKHAYSPAARQEFLKEADYFLVAEALGGSHVVVTFEGSHPTAVKRVYIPDVCDGVGVTYERPFRVYEHLGLCLS